MERRNRNVNYSAPFAYRSFAWILTNLLFDPLKSFRCCNCSLMYRNQLGYDCRLAWRWDLGRRKNHPCRNFDTSNIHETLCCSPPSVFLPRNFLALTILQMHGRNQRWRCSNVPLQNIWCNPYLFFSIEIKNIDRYAWRAICSSKSYITNE